MAVFLRKWLGIGKLPDDMRAAIEAEGVLHLAEFVPVTFRFSGKVPGKTAKGNFSSYVGALALTNQRVLGTRCCSRIRKAQPAASNPIKAHQASVSLVSPTMRGESTK